MKRPLKKKRERERKIASFGFTKTPPARDDIDTLHVRTILRLIKKSFENARL